MADKTKIKIELDWGRTKDELKSVEKRISAIGERIASVRKECAKEVPTPKAPAFDPAAASPKDRLAFLHEELKRVKESGPDALSDWTKKRLEEREARKTPPSADSVPSVSPDAMSPKDRLAFLHEELKWVKKSGPDALSDWTKERLADHEAKKSEVEKTPVPEIPKPEIPKSPAIPATRRMVKTDLRKGEAEEFVKKYMAEKYADEEESDAEEADSGGKFFGIDLKAIISKYKGLQAVVNGVCKAIEASFIGMGNLVKSTMTGVGKFIEGTFKSVNNLTAGFTTFLKKSFEGVGATFKSAFTGLGKLADGAFKSVSNIVQGFAGFVKDIFAGIGSLIYSTFAGIGKFVGGTFSALTGIVQGFGTMIKRAFEGLGAAVKSAISGIGKFVGGVFQSLTSIVQGFGTMVRRTFEGIGAAVNSVVTGIGKTFQGIFTGLGRTFQQAFDGLGTTARGFLRGFGRLGEDAFRGFGRVAYKSMDGIGDTLRSTFTGAGTLIRGVFTGTSRAAQQLIPAIGGVFTGLFRRFGNMIAGAGRQNRTFASNTVSTFSGMRTKILGIFGEIKQGIKLGIGMYMGAGIASNVASVVASPITMVSERLDKLKSAREAMRDLKTEQQRLIDMNNKLGFTMSGSIEQYMDLKIAMEKLEWQNRNLTAEDRRRESAIQKVRDCFTAMKETITDMMMSVVDFALPYLDKLTQTLEDFIPKAIGVCMGVAKNLPAIWESSTDLMALGVEKLSKILSYAFSDYLPRLIAWFIKRVQKIMGDGFSFQSLGMKILTGIGEICKSIFGMFVRVGRSIANIIGTIGKNAWEVFRGKKSIDELFDGAGESARAAFDPNLDPYTGQRRKPKKEDEKEDELPAWNREKSKDELALEAKMGGLFEKIDKDSDESTKWAKEQLERNKEFRKQETNGTPQPITDTEIARQQMRRQQAATEDVMGAYMRINNAIANRNPALIAAEKQMAQQKQIAAEQAKRDEARDKKLEQLVENSKAPPGGQAFLAVAPG